MDKLGTTLGVLFVTVLMAVAAVTVYVDRSKETEARQLVRLLVSSVSTENGSVDVKVFCRPELATLYYRIRVEDLRMKAIAFSSDYSSLFNCPKASGVLLVFDHK